MGTLFLGLGLSLLITEMPVLLWQMVEAEIKWLGEVYVLEYLKMPEDLDYVLQEGSEMHHSPKPSRICKRHGTSMTNQLNDGSSS